MMRNPLLENAPLPVFSQIEPRHVEPAIDQILSENRKTIDELLNTTRPHTWEKTLLPLEAIQERLNQTWSPVRHLHGVADSDELRKAYAACLPKLSDYATDLGQHEGLYQAYKSVATGVEYQQLGEAERKIMDNALRDFRLSGIELDPLKKARFKEIKQRLSRIQTTFEEHLLDATQGWKMEITDPEKLSGLPEMALALARQTAAREGKEGWVFTLDFPSYMPVMTYADDRALRFEMYQAYVTRASDQGPQAGRWDNSEVMVEILALRRELANLLGFKDYTEYSLVTKMAKDPERVMQFLKDLGVRSKPVAEREFSELRAFAAEADGLQEVAAWDVAYYSEKLRQRRYAISKEELRPYFPAPRALEGMFEVVHRLYGVTVTAREGVDVWHPDVRFFEIHDEAGDPRGMFYLDLYARPHKRGGAWMDECRNRQFADSGIQPPVAYLTCNFTPPVGEAPSLLTHEEVTTLFHEFGHGLHHMLTRVHHPSVAGVNGVEWDAVELPSQFMENWCWEREALDFISGHYQTGEPIGAEMLERMLKAKNFQSGLQMLRQLEFALFDFRMHRHEGDLDGAGIQRLTDEVRDEVAMIKPPAWNRFQHGFSHIFAGGYAAGYYSYKWAEVLSADAFSKFEACGIFCRETGEQFLHAILERGGTRDALAGFIEFRGREPVIEHLLRRSGIAA
jgi:oligopeptidase A